MLTMASASGRGSRSPVLVNGAYSADLSRRVEIKIRVRSAEQQLRNLETPTRQSVPGLNSVAAPKPAVPVIPPAPPALNKSGQ
jgi:hypothetical protein